MNKPKLIKSCIAEEEEEEEEEEEILYISLPSYSCVRQVHTIQSSLTLLHVSIIRSSSGSILLSLLKLQFKTLGDLLRYPVARYTAQQTHRQPVSTEQRLTQHITHDMLPQHQINYNEVNH